MVFAEISSERAFFRLPALNVLGIPPFHAGKTILEALNTDLVCDAINTAMRELFLQIVYGRTQSAFSEGGLMIGAGLEDLGKSSLKGGKRKLPPLN